MAEKWKFFVVELTYQIPFESFGRVLDEHRVFLQQGYAAGWMLFSGPQTPPTGGLIVCRAPSREAIETFFENDPFHVKHVATYRFIEFDPVKRVDWIEAWVTGTGEVLKKRL